jgi:hypothetical protein
MVITTPFSMAATSLSMIAAGLYIIIALILNGRYLFQAGKAYLPLTWMLIPGLYFISLLYSANFDRGWHHILILWPLIVLPLFFIIADLRETKQRLITLLAASAVCSVLFHLIPTSYWPVDWVHLSGTRSLFFSSTQNSWIWWSALLTLILKKDKTIWADLAMCVLVIGLMYLGQIGFLFISYLLYLIEGWKTDRDELMDLLNRAMIFLPVFFILGWIFFNDFQHAINNLSEAILSLYTREEILGPVKWFALDARASFAQWWNHPFTGVGVGDYTDAMWNQYQAFKMDPPPYAPYQQINHMLVSAGILTLPALGYIWYRSSVAASQVKNICKVLILSLVIYAPFESQINAFVFLLPLLLSSIPERDE